MWDIIPNSIKHLHNLFKAHNKKLFIVGGAIRDFLNNETPKDYDLATDALPEEVIEILENYNIRYNQQGKAFGVIVAYTSDYNYEIATFREDVYGDKLGETRNPDVKFSTIDKDVLRRDLTFNALFYDIDKQEVVDLVGGVDDINNKITKFVGNPDERIEEDPLRILRLIRFASRYNFIIDENSINGIKNNSHKLSIITKERIWEEIRKAYKQSKSFLTYLNYLIDFGVIDVIYNGLKVNKFLEHLNRFEQLSLDIYFSYLFIDNNTDGLLDILKFNFKMEHDISRNIVFYLNLLKLNNNSAISLNKNRSVCNISTDELLNWYRINNLMSIPIYRAFLYYKPTVKADELMKIGFKNKALGYEIQRLELEKFANLLNEV